MLPPSPIRARLAICLLLATCKSSPPPASPSAVAPAVNPSATPSAHITGRPDLQICDKGWTPEQCCAFLCRCLADLCADSGKGGPGIASCASWCPKLSDKARRCHVYHCYVSVSPTGGIKDHDSHCGHAADQLPGGACPAEVWE
jgi:hypothetical protein